MVNLFRSPFARFVPFVPARLPLFQQPPMDSANSLGISRQGTAARRSTFLKKGRIGGRSLATTGSPQAEYSKAFTGMFTRNFGTSCNGLTSIFARPMLSPSWWPIRPGNSTASANPVPNPLS